ncbi:MAG TPA: IlvD/Edd family dehydratase [Pseudonocardiaceae bacterium]|nr:IlvD/Edd family dehydratase [Pseudonocardiaceae bacterium]
MTDPGPTLRSRQWFDAPGKPDMAALYLERYMNYGLTREELAAGGPIIGIAQTGSDLTPCNRHHVELAQRVRDGIRTEGGVALEFPVHPLQETGKRPTAALDRNLAYLGLVEVLYGYPLDGVVLTTGCDKTTPACLMAAATVNIPAIVLSGGPMLNGWFHGRRAGAGSTIWRAREMLANGEITEDELIERVAATAPSPGHCTTMGTALTMNSLVEVLGMSLPGCAAIPAPHRDRARMAYLTGRRIVELVRADRKPSDILTRAAFENAIVLTSALGGSTNAPIHVNAVAAHAGVDLDMADWERHGNGVPVLVNVQPAGEYLAEDFHRAGGVPAVIGELLRGGLLHGDTMTVTGQTLSANYVDAVAADPEIIRGLDRPLLDNGGFAVLRGNLADSAVMKTSVISPSFRARYLSDPADPDVLELRAVVFDGPEEYRAHIDDPARNIDERCVLVMRGAGPVGYPGSAEVVNMRPPAALLRAGVDALPCLGDGRQSGTSAAPSVLNLTPEAAAGGPIALVRDGDLIRIDIRRRSVDLLVGDDELAARRTELDRAGGYPVPTPQTPWQEAHGTAVSQLAEGMVLNFATGYQRIAQERGIPRDNH